MTVLYICILYCIIFYFIFNATWIYHLKITKNGRSYFFGILRKFSLKDRNKSRIVFKY